MTTLLGKLFRLLPLHVACDFTISLIALFTVFYSFTTKLTWLFMSFLSFNCFPLLLYFNTVVITAIIVIIYLMNVKIHVNLFHSCKLHLQHHIPIVPNKYYSDAYNEWLRSSNIITL